MGFKNVYCLVFLLTITSAITEVGTLPTPTKSTEMELSGMDINPEATKSDYEPTSSTAVLSSSVVVPGPNCTSNPHCPSPWEGENWTDNTVTTHTRVIKCYEIPYSKTETKMTCTYGLFQLFEYCSEMEVTVEKTREVCYCERGSRRVQKLLNEEIEGKTALSAAGFCELGSNNSHDIVLQVVAPPKKKITISVRNAYINCSIHTLTIRDLPCGEPHMICGQVNNTTIISTTGRLQIRFRGKCEESNIFCSFDGNILFIEDPQGDDKC